MLRRFDTHLPTRAMTVHCRNWTHDESIGLPVVLLHGWPGSSATWSATVELLPRDRHYLAPDLRGLGDSQRVGSTDDFQKRSLALDIQALLNQLGLEKVIIVGQDWGGVIAQELAISMPERIAGMIVLNINLVNNPRGNASGRKALSRAATDSSWFITYQAIPGLAEAMVPGNEDPWIRYFMSHTAPGNEIPDSLLSEYVRCYSIAGTAKYGARFYRSLPRDYQRWVRLDGFRFEVPSLIIHGDHDPLITREFFEGFEDCFSKVGLLSLAAGHFVQDERPADVAHGIQRFLQQVDPTRDS